MAWLALGASTVAVVVALTSILLRRADSRTLGRQDERIKRLEGQALRLRNALARARTADPSRRRLDELFGHDGGAAD